MVIDSLHEDIQYTHTYIVALPHIALQHVINKYAAHPHTTQASPSPIPPKRKQQADDYVAIPSLDPTEGVPPDDAIPLYTHNDIPPERTVELHTLHKALRSLDDVAAAVAVNVGQVGPRLLEGGALTDPHNVHVVVNMPCMYFALDSSRCVYVCVYVCMHVYICHAYTKLNDIPAVNKMTNLLHTPSSLVHTPALPPCSALPELQSVAYLLYFPIPLITLAEEAVTALHALMATLPSNERLTGRGRRRRAHPRFHGLAIRNHAEYEVFTTDNHPAQWEAYERALLAELAASGAPCFVGFEELQDVEDGWDVLERRLTVDAHLCSAVFHMGHALPAQRRHVLADQQLVLLDFMVLYKAHTIVAHEESLLAVFLSEFRHLPRHGSKPRGKVARVRGAHGDGHGAVRGGLFTTRNADGVVEEARVY